MRRLRWALFIVLAVVLFYWKLISTKQFTVGEGTQEFWLTFARN